VDDLKSLMRRFVDEFPSKGDEAVADELLADIFRTHTAPPGMSPGKQGVKAYFAAFRRAVPDLHAQVHDMTRRRRQGGDPQDISRHPSTSFGFATASSSSTGTCSTPSP
jgi:hypothetical protein